MATIDTVQLFWKNNERYWFDSTREFDQEVTNLYSHLLDNYQDYDNSNIDPLNKILLLDQLSRHIYREDSNHTHIVKKYHTIALPIALHILESGLDISNYQPWQRVFILLVLRHTFEIKYIRMAIKRVQKYRENLENDSPYYTRFLRSSFYSYSKLFCREIVNTPNDDYYIYSDHDINDILDGISPLFNTLDNASLKCPLGDEFKKHIKSKKVIVSLSGGVDSMVCTFVLKRLGYDVSAVMIDYNNRDTCKIEVEFVRKWCKCLGIRVYVCRIPLLKRTRDKDRELYEDVTKRFRFDMYREFDLPIILGHNADDCFENIITNTIKGINYGLLKGMNHYSEIDGVTIIRPMLDISKKDIVSFAQKHGVPFLEDSTPKWSRRGMIRDTLVPAFNRFDPNLIIGLRKLADANKEMYLYQEELVNTYWQNNYDENRIIITDRAYMYGTEFWKGIIWNFCEVNSLPIPSQKSISMLTKRVSGKQYGTIQMSTKLSFIYKDDALQL